MRSPGTGWQHSDRVKATWRQPPVIGRAAPGLLPCGARGFLDAARHQRFHHLVVGHLRRVAIASISAAFVLELQALERGLLAALSPSSCRQARDDLVVELAPSAIVSSRSLWRMKRRIAARALPVIAKLSQLGCGSCALERRICDLVAILERRAQRHDAAVDLGADRLVAEIGVHGISEVDRRRALGQLDQLALGGEGEDAVLVHRHAGMLEQLLGRLGMVEDLDEVADPATCVSGRFACPCLYAQCAARPNSAWRACLGADLDFDARIAPNG
jgi:hypothetical protein